MLMLKMSWRVYLMGKVIGIDLGTTYSCVAVADRDGPRVLLSRTGQATTPSVVATTEAGKRLVGQLAKRQAITNPANTIYGAKRLIGRRWSSPEAQAALELLSYPCEAGPHDDIRVRMGGKAYAIPEISSMVLHEMRLVAEKALGETVTQAVVTVPAYFNDNQRQATQDAARIAGLEVLRILNEPTAAALAYGFGRKLEQRVAICDLGGGTFDISILEIGQDVFEVLATAGDTLLGGEDFDTRIIQWLADDFQAAHGIDLRQDKMALQRLRDAAEKAKVELSGVDEVELSLPFIHVGPQGAALHIQTKLTRVQLDAMVGDLVQACMRICVRVLEQAKLTREDLNAVVLVGGMAHMPLVQIELEKTLGLPPCKGAHPQQAVACGAALEGMFLSEGSNETLLLDVTPHDMGITVDDGKFDVLIDRDTTLPTSARKTFIAVRDGQTQMRIKVLQGQAPCYQNNDLLGEFVLDGLRAAGRGEVRVQVTFDISADGIMSVSAADLETGRAQAMMVTASSGLTGAEIVEMAADNERFKQTGASNDAFEGQRVETERILRDVEKLLGDASAKLAGTDVGATAVSKVQEAMSAAREATAKRDTAGLAQAHAALERSGSFLRTMLTKQLGR